MKKMLPILAVLALAIASLACVESTEVANLQSTESAVQDQVENGGTPVPNTEDYEVETGSVDVEFTLTTGGDGHGLSFIGVGGDIDGVMNPTLIVEPGDVVQITLINGQATEHDLLIDEFGASSGSITAMGEEAVITFTADQEGMFNYYCGIPGHRAAGMVGNLQVGAGASADAENIIK